jgi:hypothetical protein
LVTCWKLVVEKSGKLGHIFFSQKSFVGVEIIFFEGLKSVQTHRPKNTEILNTVICASGTSDFSFNKFCRFSNPIFFWEKVFS